ncbi:MAG: zinc ribbon domain-containing protein [Butyricicoccaceae bacterium]
MFTGIAFCADCGRAMSTVGTRRKGSRADLACGGYKQHGRSACTRHGTNYEALEATVLDVLHRHLALTEREKAELRERLMHSLCSQEGRTRTVCGAVFSRTEDTIAALYLDRASGRVAADSFYAALHRLEEQAAALRRRLDMRETDPPDAARLESVIDECCCPSGLHESLFALLCGV